MNPAFWPSAHLGCQAPAAGQARDDRLSGAVAEAVEREPRHVRADGAIPGTSSLVHNLLRCTQATIQADRQGNCPVVSKRQGCDPVEQYLDFARELADDLLVIGRGQAAVAGAKGDTEERELRRYPRSSSDPTGGASWI
jgi:hypothetical protein